MTNQHLPWLDIPNGKDAIPTSEDISSPHRFMWGLDARKHYSLLYLLNTDNTEVIDLEIPNLQAIDIFVTTTSPCYLVISLLDSALIDIFYDFCLDLIATTTAQSSRREGLISLINRCWRWHSLLVRQRSSVLSETQQQGLYAELAFMIDYLLPRYGIAQSLQLWHGPFGANHDFSSDQLDIEIKSSKSTGTPRIKISSEFQLERAISKPLFMVFYTLSSDNHLGESIRTLAEKISNIIAKESPASYGLFQTLLDSVGFSWAHDYEDFLWSIHSVNIYEITDDFPAILRANLANAIHNVSYELRPSELDSFVVAFNQFLPKQG